jgi:MFS family permease
LKEKTRTFYGYYVVAGGFFVWFIGWGAYSTCFGVYMKPLLAHFGWSRADASLAYSLMCMVQASAAILMGWLTDRVGSRLLIAGFGSFLGISYFLLSQADTLWQFQLSYGLIGGIGTSVLNIPVVVAISRWFNRSQGTMMGIVQAGGGIGGFLFPPLTGWFILNYGWRESYLWIGVFILVGLVAAGLLVRTDPSEKGQHREGEEGAAAKNPGRPPKANPGLRAVLLRGPFWMLVGIFGSFGFCRATFLAHIAAHTQDLGFTLSDGAFITALISGASILGRLGTGGISDRMGNKTTLAVSFGITLASILWVMISGKLWMLYLFALAFGLTWGAQAVLRFTMSTEVFGLSSLGFLLGLLSFMEAMCAMLGSYMGGYLFDLFGTYQPVFWLTAVLAAFGCILSCLLRPVAREAT